MEKKERTGANLIVESLINHDVKHIFGIPGAKIDGVFDTLQDEGPELIVTRHEQNAAFMAQAVGRLTGKPGVVIATSGPGASNLATGLVTATAEGDPILALAGQVKRSDLMKLTHQSMDNAALFDPITKYSTEVQDPETLSEVIANGYRMSKTAKKGASFISIPQDVTDSPVKGEAIRPLSDPNLGTVAKEDLDFLVNEIKQAKLPVLLVGMRGSSKKEVVALRQLLEKTHLPIVETFQAAGVLSRELESSFFGRVGLFRNQPGDMLLKRSDLVIAVGYDPIEYEARNWNKEKSAQIIVIDEVPAEIDSYFQPKRELIVNIAQTLDLLSDALAGYEMAPDATEYLNLLRGKLNERDVLPADWHVEGKLHPLEIVNILQANVTDKMTVAVDVGSHYIWMARHFRSYVPRHLLFSNGMQTLGVALPWAIAAALVRPNETIFSISGDGGFLFSGQELETAVRLKQKIIQIIWNDGKYNMVEFQEQLKYNRTSGVDFGPVDFVKYAEAFGAKGLRATSKAGLQQAITEALASDGPVIIDVPVDYSDNAKLAETMLPDQFY